MVLDQSRAENLRDQSTAGLRYRDWRANHSSSDTTHWAPKGMWPADPSWRDDSCFPRGGWPKWAARCCSRIRRSRGTGCDTNSNMIFGGGFRKPAVRFLHEADMGRIIFAGVKCDDVECCRGILRVQRAARKCEAEDD